VIKCLLEQDINIHDKIAVAFSLSIFVASCVYKTKLTSDLVAVYNPLPVNNISDLINSGYSYLYDRSVSESLGFFLQKVNLNVTNSSLVFSNVTSILSTYESAALLRGKLFSSANHHSSGTSPILKTVEMLLHNVSCFTLEPYLHRYWVSYLFAHPQYAEMIRFTQTLKEGGIISHFHEIEEHVVEISSLSWYRKRLFDISLESRRSLFIKLNHSKSIFIIHAFFLLLCSLLFGANLYDSRSQLAHKE